eukprot:TRINITY_DN10371_c0_g1_i2.p1 TRINITY_DN10371_c0_g1~~TRINITY_DN10371_c0_g1_i2.p1  ORF type:complete len:450 (-),score=70.45 TRINITY_DN10371_c0_g1_i2:888-2237(-)
MSSSNNILSLTVMNQTGDIFPVQIDGGETVANLKMVLEFDTSIPAQQQELVLNGKPLKDSQSLTANGVSNGDLLLIVNRNELQQQQQQQQRQQQQQQAGGGNMNQEYQMLKMFEDIFKGVVEENGRVNNAQQHLDRIKNNPTFMARINMMIPRLAQIINQNNVQEFERFAKEIHHQLDRLKREQEILTGDPMDPEVQKRIEEKIQEEAVQDSYNMAMEHHPELFFRTDMLYVKMQVNGVDIKAFVDTGAQMSIMTEDCASKVNLMRLMDKRFQGMAMGVGTAEIVGRIHQAPIKIDDQFVPCAITVLRQKSGPEFIFGLDMLKQHLCSVDLHKNVLRFTSINVELPFLTGDELPAAAQELERQKSREIMQNMPSSSSNPPQNPTPQHRPTTTTTAPQNTQSNNQNKEMEEKIQQLMSLGFERNECEQALKLMGGDVDQAAAALFASKGM